MPELDQYGRSIGSRIAIHDGEAEIVRRIFREHREGVSLADIDPRAGRAQLLRWLKDGKLRVTLGPDGKPYAKGELIPFTILAVAENTKPAEQLGGFRGSSVYELRSGGAISTLNNRKSFRFLLT